MLEMMWLLQEHPNIVMDETADPLEERKEEPPEGSDVKVWGNLVAFVERLDDELFRALQVRGRLEARGPSLELQGSAVVMACDVFKEQCVKGMGERALKF